MKAERSPKQGENFSAVHMIIKDTITVIPDKALLI
jgi:hypothetical protein